MPLPELSYKWDHMPKSVVWILFNNKCEVQRQGEIGRGEGEGVKEKEIKKKIIPTLWI